MAAEKDTRQGRTIRREDPALPQPSGNYPEGSAMLERLEHQRRILDNVFRSMRPLYRGRLRFSLDMVIGEALRVRPDLHDIERRFFTFTGQNVMLNERAFFEEYAQTEEGAGYFRDMDGDDRAGHLARVRH